MSAVSEEAVPASALCYKQPGSNILLDAASGEHLS